MIGTWIVDVNGQHEPPVRKISMTILLNHESHFSNLEFMEKNKIPS